MSDGFYSPETIRYVSPVVYREQYREHLRRDNYFTDEVVMRALALAADPDGFLRDFSEPEFFTTCVSAAMKEEDDPDDWKLEYSRFVFIPIFESLARLVRYGLLAHRGNGDTVDYRLALPLFVSEDAVSKQAKPAKLPRPRSDTN